MFILILFILLIIIALFVGFKYYYKKCDIKPTYQIKPNILTKNNNNNNNSFLTNKYYLNEK